MMYFDIIETYILVPIVEESWSNGMHYVFEALPVVVKPKGQRSYLVKMKRGDSMNYYRQLIQKL